MNITLNDTELRDAVTEYVVNKGFSIPQGQVPSIDFKVGRAGNGTSAAIEFVEESNTATVESVSDELPEDQQALELDFP